MNIISNRSRFVKLACVSLAIIAASAFVVARRRSSVGDSPAKIDSTTQAPKPTRRIANMESELITITPHGFEPREITRPKGRFLLMVDNRSGEQSVSPNLKIDAPAAPTFVRGLRVPREQPNWSDEVDLLPGRYTLTEPGHPLWTCRITITAQ